MFCLAMDTSNPVVSSDRRSFREISAVAARRVRQNTNLIADAARTTQRVELPVGVDLYPVEEVKTTLEDLHKLAPRISTEVCENLDCKIFREAHPHLPVCGLLDRLGVPIHPPGVAQSGGHVVAVRTFGGSIIRPLGELQMAQVMGEDLLSFKKLVYTHGTWDGFSARLSQQMGRTTTPIRETIKKVEGFLPNNNFLFGLLNSLMPRDESVGWASLGDPIPNQLEGIQVTMNSSAGPPYWRKKVDCWSHILDVGLPTFVQAIKTGTLDDLFRKEPEMFLVEIKNKEDRYEFGAVDGTGKPKTRPYTTVPAHIGLLASVLTQRFQDGLKTFVESPSSHNAYGFSSSKGGLTQMVEWMDSTKEGETKFVCYGDDTCLVSRYEGNLYRVDPDFSQMDGSLDSDDILCVIEWVLHSLKKEDNLNSVPFWETFSKVWHYVASDPLMIVQGQKIWKKARPNGLMTGVPGTTLFDTVKSVVSWHCYLQFCSFKKRNPLDGALATEFMSSHCGLVIKEGTWEPALVPQQRTIGTLITEHKFLGVQIRQDLYKGQVIHVPTIDRETALTMCIIQKDDPLSRNRSKLGTARTLFDRMRGLFLTFGFTDPVIVDLIHNVVNSLPPEAILLDTQLLGGEKPDHILMQNFSWPDSSGFPSIDFAKSIYAHNAEPEGWISLFPQLDPILDQLRVESRRTFRVLVGGEAKVVVMQEPTDHDYDPELEVPEAVKKGTFSRCSDKPNPRSKVLRRDASTQVEEKYIPDLPQTLSRLVGDRVLSVGEAARELATTPTRVIRSLPKAGLFATAPNSDALIARVPFETPNPEFQETLVGKIKEEAQTVSKHSRDVMRAAKAVSTGRPEVFVKTAPLSVYVNKEFLVSLDPVPARETPVKTVQALAASNGYFYRWVKGTIDETRGASHPILLQFCTRNSIIAVAAAASATYDLAKDYAAASAAEFWPKAPLAPVPESEMDWDAAKEGVTDEWAAPRLEDFASDHQYLLAEEVAQRHSIPVARALEMVMQLWDPRFADSPLYDQDLVEAVDSFYYPESLSSDSTYDSGDEDSHRRLSHLQDNQPALDGSPPHGAVRVVSGDVAESTSEHIMHCVSADFAMSQGAALTLSKMFGIGEQQRQNLAKQNKGKVGTNVVYTVTEKGKVYFLHNLVTKLKYSDKPKPEDFEKALRALSTTLDWVDSVDRATGEPPSTQVIEGPLIGTGLDALPQSYVISTLSSIMPFRDFRLYSLDKRTRSQKNRDRIRRQAQRDPERRHQHNRAQAEKRKLRRAQLRAS